MTDQFHTHDPALHDAFLRTRFTVDLDGTTHEIQVSKRLPPTLEKFVKGAGKQNWVYITAWNPQSTPLSQDENQARHDALLQDISDRYLSLPGVGIASDGKWREESLFVVGTDIAQSADMGRSYGQLCVVIGKTGDIARLLYCDSGQIFPS